jgi:hypothetical protein
MSVAHFALFVVVESSRAGTERLSLCTLCWLSDAQSHPHSSASPQALETKWQTSLYSTYRNDFLQVRSTELGSRIQPTGARIELRLAIRQAATKAFGNVHNFRMLITIVICYRETTYEQLWIFSLMDTKAVWHQCLHSYFVSSCCVNRYSQNLSL